MIAPSYFEFVQSRGQRDAASFDVVEWDEPLVVTERPATEADLRLFGRYLLEAPPC